MLNDLPFLNLLADSVVLQGHRLIDFNSCPLEQLLAFARKGLLNNSFPLGYNLTLGNFGTCTMVELSCPGNASNA